MHYQHLRSSFDFLVLPLRGNDPLIQEITSVENIKNQIIKNLFYQVSVKISK